ncbi:MAG: hypothetical protein ACXABY_33035 [Candidatus Thorarchaeota archaeon]|jgi:hypothetical protein
MTTTRKCQATKLQVTVGTAEEMGLDPADGDCKWYLICEEHSTICGFANKALAVRHSSWPEWCEECQPLLEEINNGT